MRRGALLTPAHQTEDRIGSARAQRQGRLMTNKVTARNLVKELDGYREANRGVQIAFWNMQAETFCQQAQANHQQEA